MVQRAQAGAAHQHDGQTQALGQIEVGEQRLRGRAIGRVHLLEVARRARDRHQQATRRLDYDGRGSARDNLLDAQQIDAGEESLRLGGDERRSGQPEAVRAELVERLR